MFIAYTNNMEVRKRSRAVKVNIDYKRLKPFILIALVLLLLIAFYSFISARLLPALKDLASVRVNALVSDAMYNSVLEKLADAEEYENFLTLSYENDRVVYSQINNKALTVFASECANLSQEKLISYGTQGVKVPVGTASGIALFAGAGPNITMRFTPETNTQAYFRSEFSSAGINQTLHKVMLKLEAQVAVILPGENLMIFSYVDVPVAEQLIVGDVPETYVDFNNTSGQLSLVPEG